MNPNSTPPEGLCGPVAASGGESEDGYPEAANGPQTATGGPDPHAVILDAISTTLNAAGYWLPIEGRRAVAGAALKASSDEAEKWRRRAIRRAIDLGRAERTLIAIQGLAAEQVTDTTAWGDGYREGLRDLGEPLAVFAPSEHSTTA